MNFDASQQQAIDAAIKQRDTIITGGAGTGKTTIIRAIADAFHARGERPEIVAPTGKAAARLKEATGHDACTIHRALMWDASQFRRQHDFAGPVIADESSMIDAWLMAQMLRYHPRQLVLVGDAAQLPPVGKGQPFHDLIHYRQNIVQTLTTCYRASGAVHKAAMAVREGVSPAPREKAGGESWRVVKTGGPRETIAQISAWVTDGYLDPTQDIILASKYGKGDSDDGGIKAINAAVKAILNPSEDKFAVGDRVICNKNFSADDLWNGDLGTITDIDVQGMPWVTLDRDPDDPRLLDKDQNREIAHAYCLSVHKAQGSQFRNVFFACFRSHWFMLSRSLIYTAITRAQRGVCVIGEPQAFYGGINRVEEKRTVIQELARRAA